MSIQNASILMEHYMKNKKITKFFSFVNKLAWTIFAINLSCITTKVIANTWITNIIHLILIPLLCLFAFVYELSKKIIRSIVYAIVIYVVVALLLFGMPYIIFGFF